jgi:hypothetical protein
MQGSIDIKGLEEVIASLRKDKLDATLAINLGKAVKDIHFSIKDAVFNRYNLSKDMEKVFTNFTSSTKRGVDSLGIQSVTSELVYKDTQRDLSKFPFSPDSIAGFNGKSYAVHNVSIIKGRTVPVRGLSGNGGFVPRSKANISYTNAYGTQMFERVNGSRTHLRLLLGTTVVNMINYVYDNDPKVQETKRNISNTLTKDLLA